MTSPNVTSDDQPITLSTRLKNKRKHNVTLRIGDGGQDVNDYASSWPFLVGKRRWDPDQKIRLRCNHS